MNWQPIETAPKDGTEVLLYDAERKQYDIGYCDDADPDYWWALSGTPMRCFTPTHWRELEPPK